MTEPENSVVMDADEFLAIAASILGDQMRTNDVEGATVVRIDDYWACAKAVMDYIIANRHTFKMNPKVEAVCRDLWELVCDAGLNGQRRPGARIQPFDDRPTGLKLG